MNIIKKLSALCAVLYIALTFSSCSVEYRERHRPPPPPVEEKVIVRP